jgi:hypothetical protein
VLQYKIESIPIRSRPASSSAFSSACRQRHMLTGREGSIRIRQGGGRRGARGIIKGRTTAASSRARVASRAAALVAIAHPSGRAIVAGRDDAVASDEQGPDPTLHAVAPQTGKAGEGLASARPRTRRQRLSPGRRAIDEDGP